MSSSLSTKIIIYSIIALFFVMMEIGYIRDNWLDESSLEQTNTQTATEGTLAETPPSSIQTCIEETKCINSTSLGSQYTNCTLIPQPCPEGCFNNSCLEVVCSEKFLCKNETIRAFQNKDCTWKEEDFCEFGCEDGECTSEPAVEKNESAGPLGDTNVLYAGKRKQITLGEKAYNLSIYLIESGQVQIQINDDESDWLTQGQNFTSYGLTFTPTEIYFQSWGLQAVVYEVK